MVGETDIGGKVAQECDPLGLQIMIERSRYDLQQSETFMRSAVMLRPMISISGVRSWSVCAVCPSGDAVTGGWIKNWHGPS
jgi:hypothetical protein